MNKHWQPLLERLWPSRVGPSDVHGWRNVLLHAALVIAIGLAAGPELFAAMEMTTLLEILGASLFLTAFAAGAKLTAIAFCRVIRNFVSSIPHVSLIRSNAPLAVRALASVYVAVQAAIWLGLAIATGMFGHHVFVLVSGWPAA